MEQSNVISVFARPLERLELLVEQHVARLGLGESWAAERTSFLVAEKCGEFGDGVFDDCCIEAANWLPSPESPIE